MLIFYYLAEAIHGFNLSYKIFSLTGWIAKFNLNDRLIVLLRLWTSLFVSCIIMSCPSLSISSGIFSFNLATEFWDTFQFCCIGCCHMRCNEWLHPSFLVLFFWFHPWMLFEHVRKPWPWTSFSEAGFSCASASLSDVLTFLKPQGLFMWNYSCFVWKGFPATVIIR